MALQFHFPVFFLLSPEWMLFPCINSENTVCKIWQRRQICKIKKPQFFLWSFSVKLMFLMEDVVFFPLCSCRLCFVTFPVADIVWYIISNSVFTVNTVFNAKGHPGFVSSTGHRRWCDQFLVEPELSILSHSTAPSGTGVKLNSGLNTKLISNKR